MVQFQYFYPFFIQIILMMQFYSLVILLVLVHPIIIFFQLELNPANNILFKIIRKAQRSSIFVNMINEDRRIQRLDKDVAEQITSQQIIPTLHECIKELIDNSIDAKAALIKIELNQYGKVDFSVFDNGSGIAQVQKLGQGGNTSKLKINQNTQEDYLQGIRTLGFRGQALNSIGNLCKDMLIHTVFQDVLNQSQASSFIEAKYSITQKSVLEKKKSFAKQTFTKISVTGLFHTLPVRKHQLDNRPKQNIKRVYQLVFQISLIFPQITFVLTNILQGREEILFNIQRHSYQKSRDLHNDSDYFYRDIPKDAWKQRIEICFPNKLENCLVYVKSKNVEGFILNTIDSGSSKKNLKFSKNFQFTFINRRPINAIKEICKLFDGYYKKYNPYTKYVFFLNLKVQPNQIDVNLSPNKRDIYIKKDRLDEILKQIKALIEKQVIERIINLQEFKQAKMRKTQERSQKNDQKQEEDQFDNNKGWNRKESKKIQESNSINIRKQVFRSNISQSVQERSLKDNYLGNYRPIVSQKNMSALDELNSRIQETKIEPISKLKSYHSLIQEQLKNESQVNKKKSYAPIEQSQSEQENSQSEQRQMQKQEIINSRKDEIHIKNQTKLKDDILKGLTHMIKPYSRKNTQLKVQIAPNRQNEIKSYRSQKSQPKQVYELEKNQLRPQLRISELQKSDHKVKQQQKQIKNHLSSQQQKKKANIIKNLNIIPQNDKIREIQIKKQEFAEFILQKNIYYVTQQNRGDIKKEDFRKFHIHGQFNKGFILCSFKQKQYLYIIDQHASEEKHLFESFMESKPQFLYLSKQIPITPLQVDQIETARAQLNSSGFTFVIKNRSVLKILKCPSHFKKNFGLEEFLQIVDTNKNIKDIPSFYNAAASKACRSAVMIGDELIRNKMIDIVHRMSDLKSPWNCPHGRPSLISLGNFKSIISKIKSQKHVYKF